MRQKLTLLLLMALFAVGGVKAKTSTTTLWESTYTDNIQIEKSNLVQGATITVYANVTTTETADNRKLRVFYCKNDNKWTQISFDGLDWHELEAGDGKTYSFTISEAMMTTLNDNTENSGSRGVLYIGAYNKDYVTITKITMTETLTPSSTTNISSDSYAADWDGKAYDAVAAAQIGDVIQFSFTATGTWLQMYVMNNSKDNEWQTDAYSITNGESYTYEYVIPDYATLKKIRTEGFSIKGADYQVTSVDLLTYADSYGYTTVTIGDTGYATWSSDKKYDFASAGITAYYASAVEKGTVTLTSMDITWDWQGYILKAATGEYDVMQTLTNDGTYFPSINYLKAQVDEGTVKASQSGDTKFRYILAKHGSDIGFYKLTTDHPLGAHKAYLETDTDITPTGTNAARLAIIFDDGQTTSINSAQERKVEDGIYYNLSGQRVKNPSKGLYIVNGKKVFVK